MRNVPYIDLIGQHAGIKDEILDAVSSVIDKADFILGSEVQKFEKNISSRAASLA